MDPNPEEMTEEQMVESARKKAREIRAEFEGRESDPDYEKAMLAAQTLELLAERMFEPGIEPTLEAVYKVLTDDPENYKQ